MVKIVFPTIIAKVTNGEKEVIVSASTINDVLTQLSIKYGTPFKETIFDSSGKPKRFLNFYLNGRNIRFMKNFDTPLKITDILIILPSVGGG
jgi:molybdopterin converting factor small subunit